MAIEVVELGLGLDKGYFLEERWLVSVLFPETNKASEVVSVEPPSTQFLASVGIDEDRRIGVDVGLGGVGNGDALVPPSSLNLLHP